MLISTAAMSSPALSEDVWIDILGRLGYFSLKRCQRLNRSFHALLRQPPLAGRILHGKLPEITRSLPPSRNGQAVR